MFKSCSDIDRLYEIFDDIGMKESANTVDLAVIKVNLARPPEKGHPRTTVGLIKSVVTYLSNFGVRCAIAESADGYLTDNIIKLGLKEFVEEYQVDLIDLDYEDVVEIEIEDEIHYIPKCLRKYGLRIAIPATSKRQECIYSNNIKLFVGAVPRKYYQIGEPVRWRPKVHIDLHKSVANIFTCINDYSPFHYYINGGLAMDETKGEFELSEFYVGNDALELDKYILRKYFSIEIPEYMKRLEKQ